MGFSEMVLVNPKEFPSPAAMARASGATDVLAATRVVSSLEDAVADCGLVVGVSARRRRHRWPELDSRECAIEALASSVSKPVAVVFGTERTGLLNEQMDRCNALVYIPANPEYSSLNLASAVQLIAYELRYAQGDFESPQGPEWPPASGQDMELFYEHLERVMTRSGFLKPDNPRHLMRKLRRLFNRARPDEHELSILRGLLASVEPEKPEVVDDG
jgi:TrmH family RNA methyltransferase